MSSVYRAPNAPGFGSYVAPPRPGPRPAPRPAPAPARPLEAHRAYRVVLQHCERRISRCLAVLDQRTTRPTHARWRAGRLEAHGRDSYQHELVTARELRAVCEKALRECWHRVPEAAELALRRYEQATDNAERFAALDSLKNQLLGGRKDNVTCEHRPDRARPRLPRR